MLEKRRERSKNKTHYFLRKRSLEMEKEFGNSATRVEVKVRHVTPTQPRGKNVIYQKCRENAKTTEKDPKQKFVEQEGKQDERGEGLCLRRDGPYARWNRS